MSTINNSLKSYTVIEDYSPFPENIPSKNESKILSQKDITPNKKVLSNEVNTDENGIEDFFFINPKENDDKDWVMLDKSNDYSSSIEKSDKKSLFNPLDYQTNEIIFEGPSDKVEPKILDNIFTSTKKGSIFSSFMDTIYSTSKIVISSINYGGEIIKDLESEGYDYQSSPTLKNLNQMNQLDSSSIVVLDNILKKTNDEKKFFISTLGIPSNSQIKHALYTNQRIIIPVVLIGGVLKRGLYSRDHITTLIIDPEKKQIIFLDSKGTTITDLKNQKIKENNFSDKESALTIYELFKRIIQQIKDNNPQEKKWTLYQNIRQYQYDSYNCGVHFLHYAISYVENGEISSHLENISLIRKFRKEFIEKIRTYSPKIFPIKPSTKSIVPFEFEIDEEEIENEQK